MASIRRATAAGLAVATAMGVGASGLTAAQAATYPPKTPTTCALTVINGTRINVTVGPPTGPGYTFQLERNDAGTWTRLPTVYTVSPPSYSRNVTLSSPGEYRAQCFGGPNNTDSTSPPRAVRETPPADVIVDNRDTYTPGQYETLVKGVKLPKKVQNKYMAPKYRVLCRPLKSSSAGEVTYCTYKVTKQGGLKVRVIGNRPVRVIAIITLRPKPKYRKKFDPIIKKEKWILRPKKK